MSEESKDCPKCGAPIPENAPEGLCPKCLLLGANTDTEPGYTSTMRIPKPAAPSVDQLSSAFPQYEILELIGQGGMGYVYKARQQRLDRIVALKILPESLANDPAFAERFPREGRLLAKLNHPNIVTVHDFGVMDPTAAVASAAESQETVATAAPQGRSTGSAPVEPTHRYYFLVMEYIDGANLRQAMQAGRFTPEQALNVVPKVCEALQYAHDEGVLHRDIKPENILVDTKGRVKIADFGIAKMVDAADGTKDATLTGEGSTLGTPHYMAPEQIEQPSKVDHRADIYSLGVVFYEMLTGELPIGRFAAPSEKTSVNARVDEIVFRALEKERELRQQSAAEIKTAVETAAAQPPPFKQPRGEVVKTAQCFVSIPEYLSTFKARFSHPFTAAGDVMLQRDKLVFTSPEAEMVFKFKNIRDVSVGQMNWWSQKEGISVIAITLEGDGIERTFLLRPMGPWPEPVLQGNRHCAEWADEIRQGIAAVVGTKPRETPAQSLPLPPAPRWIMPAVIATVLFGPMFAFLGANIVGNGEKHDDLLPMVIGLGMIGANLVAVLYALMASLTFTTTRWALQRGNLHGLTLPYGTGDDSNRRGKVGNGIAYGTVAFYGGVALCYLMAAIVRFGEGGFIATVLLALLGAGGAAVSIATNPGTPRGRFRVASVIGFLLSLPVIAFGVFFLYAMTQESGGWNPALSEAVLVPLFILGTFMLPWAAFRLHGAAAQASEPASPPASQPAINPWPRRIFLLIVIIIVLPVVLFVVMLLVPYLAWNQAGAPSSPAQASLASVSTTGNVVLVDVNVWTRDRSHRLTPNFTGPALSEQLTNSSPRPGNMMLLFPTPVGKEPAVHNQFNTVQVGDRPNNYRLAFALRDTATAKAAAEHIRRSFDSMRRSQPHVRSQLFLFHIKHDNGTESYASLNFRKSRRFWVLEKLLPGQTPKIDYGTLRMEEKKLRREERNDVKLGNLPVTVSIRKLDLVNIVGKPEFDNPSTAKRPRSRVFSNRVVRAEIEIKTEPGVPAIAFNFEGAYLESSLLDAIATPLHHSKVQPAPGVAQLAFQLGRGPQPTSMLSTTMMIPLPDEAAAREVMRQLEEFRKQPVKKLVERDEVAGQFRFDFFDVPQTSRGAYSGWFLFAKGGPMRRLPAP
ncbi:MAG: serine/threonine-protein kinase, partial [Limisphaerales bacterium]